MSSNNKKPYLDPHFKGNNRANCLRMKRNIKKAQKEGIKPIAFNNRNAKEALAPSDRKIAEDMEKIKDPSAIGKLGRFPKVWEDHTSDWEILRTVNGGGLEFLTLPSQEGKPNRTRGQDLDLLRKEVEKTTTTGSSRAGRP